MTDPTLTLLDDPTAQNTLGWTIQADASVPQLLVSDLGVNRGDGIFEVAGCLAGRVQALPAHLTRFARSAAMLDLPAPNLDLYEAAVHASVAALTERRPDEELLVKFVLTRGQEMGDAGRPTGWALAYPAPDFTRERVEGIAVITVSRGVASTVADDAPWLLAGAKTLSYAVNKAVAREAKRRGAVFVSTDGFALEGPNANLIARIDGVLVTPDPAQGVLRGTTQADVFAYASGLGMQTSVRAIPVAELAEADAAWLTSSGRLIAPIRSLDGRPLAGDPEFTASVLAHLRARG